jgi:protein SDA1
MIAVGQNNPAKKVAIALKLPQLQNMIKRDPEGYRSEFLMQKRHFDSELDIFKLRPTKDSERFTELVTFMSHVCACYSGESIIIPKALMELMETHGMTLHPDVRLKIFQALILLRNKEILDPLLLIKLSFKLFAISDKTLRRTLSEFIFNDIKNINAKKNNEKLNRAVQSILFAVVADDTTQAARKTVEILGDLYRKRVWVDARTINVLGTACNSPSTRVVIAACSFFLGIEAKMLDDEDEEKKLSVTDINYHEHSKKTKKKKRNVELQKEQNEKKLRDAENRIAIAIPLFPAIQLLNDPQSLAEKLFKKLKQSGERFEVKLLLMNFISRLIGCHNLILLSFYSFLQKYLTSHQKEVTHILAYLIQACHPLVPPEDIVPVIKSIAYNFITERCTNEVMAVGINSVREIINRVPSVLKEPGMDDFIQDLAQYGRKTHKSVMVAAHGVVNLVRGLHPALLKKADRGKYHDMTNIPREYGDVEVKEGVEGAELLEAFERGEIYLDSDDEVHFKEEDDDEEGVSDSDEWSDVSGSDNEGDWEDVNSDDEDAPILVDLDTKKKDITGDDGEGSNDDDEGDWEEASDDDDDDDDDEEQEEENNEENNEEVEGGWAFVSDDDEEEDQRPKKRGRKFDPNRLTLKERRQKKSDLKSGVIEREIKEDDNTSMKSFASTIKTVEQKHRIDSNRILSSDDFNLLAKLRDALAERQRDPRYRTKGALAKIGRKRQIEEEEEENGPQFNVNPTAIAPGMKSEKQDKIDKLKRVLEGRTEFKFEAATHGGGLTNLEKKRKKNYMMIRKGKRDVFKKFERSNGENRGRKSIEKKNASYGRDSRKRRRT